MKIFFRSSGASVPSCATQSAASSFSRLPVPHAPTPSPPPISNCKDYRAHWACTSPAQRIRTLMQSRPKAPVCIRAEDIVFQMKSSHDRLIRLIALFKLLKATLLVAVGVGAFKLLHQDISSVMEHWI